MCPTRRMLLIACAYSCPDDQALRLAYFSQGGMPKVGKVGHIGGFLL